MASGVVIFSGGMDSATLAWMLAESGEALHLLSFDYGQRHSIELWYAREFFLKMKEVFPDRTIRHDIIKLQSITNFLKGSALTDSSVEVPHGHYAEDSMRLTVVPNRNAIMLSIATGIAVAEEANYVATGVHAGDHAVYPDCRPEFVSAFSSAMKLGNDGFCKPSFRIFAPFISLGKQDIVHIGATLTPPVPYDLTWSCYEGGTIMIGNPASTERSCGKCGTCVERKEAFELAGVSDPTKYA